MAPTGAGGSPPPAPRPGRFWEDLEKAAGVRPDWRVGDRPHVGRSVLVRILSASGLRNADLDGSGAGHSDPYCTCEVVGRPGAKVTTQVIISNGNPVWNHSGELHDVGLGESLLFLVWDQDHGKEDDFLGRACLTYSQVLAGFSGDLPLEEAGEGIAATLKVHVELRPERGGKPEGARAELLRSLSEPRLGARLRGARSEGCLTGRRGPEDDLRTAGAAASRGRRRPHSARAAVGARPGSVKLGPPTDKTQGPESLFYDRSKYTSAQPPFRPSSADSGPLREVIVTGFRDDAASGVQSDIANGKYRRAGEAAERPFFNLVNTHHKEMFLYCLARRTWCIGEALGDAPSAAWAMCPSRALLPPADGWCVNKAKAAGSPALLIQETRFATISEVARTSLGKGGTFCSSAARSPSTRNFKDRSVAGLEALTELRRPTSPPRAKRLQHEGFTRAQPTLRPTAADSGPLSEVIVAGFAPPAGRGDGFRAEVFDTPNGKYRRKGEVAERPFFAKVDGGMFLYCFARRKWCIGAHLGDRPADALAVCDSTALLPPLKGWRVNAEKASGVPSLLMQETRFTDMGQAQRCGLDKGGTFWSSASRSHSRRRPKPASELRPLSALRRPVGPNRKLLAPAPGIIHCEKPTKASTSKEGPGNPAMAAMLADPFRPGLRHGGTHMTSNAKSPAKRRHYVPAPTGPAVNIGPPTNPLYGPERLFYDEASYTGTHRFYAEMDAGDRSALLGFHASPGGGRCRQLGGGRWASELEAGEEEEEADNAYTWPPPAHCYDEPFGCGEGFELAGGSSLGSLETGPPDGDEGSTEGDTWVMPLFPTRSRKLSESRARTLRLV